MSRKVADRHRKKWAERPLPLSEPQDAPLAASPTNACHICKISLKGADHDECKRIARSLSDAAAGHAPVAVASQFKSFEGRRGRPTATGNGLCRYCGMDNMRCRTCKALVLGVHEETCFCEECG